MNYIHLLRSLGLLRLEHVLHDLRLFHKEGTNNAVNVSMPNTTY